MAHLELQEPPPPVGIYLDTTALIDLADALDPAWKPPVVLVDRTDKRRVAMARVFFYARRRHPNDGRTRTLYCSSMGRTELTPRTGDWTGTVLIDLDELGELDAEAIEAERARLQELGLKPKDAYHLAVANLTTWIEIFVTDDDKLRLKDGLGLRSGLERLTSVETLQTLAIAEGDHPATRPAESSPLRRRTWWLVGVGPTLD